MEKEDDFLPLFYLYYHLDFSGQELVLRKEIEKKTYRVKSNLGYTYGNAGHFLFLHM